MPGSYTIEDNSVFISQSTQIWGQVEFGSNSSAWFSTIFRSSLGHIQIGRNSHINDQTRINNSQDASMYIGQNVYIGSQCSLSDCEIGDNCYIGDRCMIYPGTIIPSGSFVAANSMLISQTIFPENSFIQGAPASSTGYVIKEMQAEHRQILARMRKEADRFRSRQPQAEQLYFLLQFSVPSTNSEKTLQALFQAGAGELPIYNHYYQTLSHKFEYYHKNSQCHSERQELLHAVACPSHKLQNIIQALHQSLNGSSVYQVLPLYFQYK